MYIREIRNSQEFQDLCQQLLAAEYDDFQIVDDSSGDKGNDGYVPSKKRLYAIYCPEKHPPPKEYYRDKINSDLRKAVKLRDELGYEIEEWIFITPAPLPEETFRHLAEKSRSLSFKRGLSWSEKNLTPLLLKHSYLQSLYPELFAPDIQKELRVGFAEVTLLQEESVTIQRDMHSGFNSLIARLDIKDDFQQKYENRVSEEYDRRFKAAKELFDQGLYSRARDAYQEILRDLKIDNAKPDPTLFWKACTNTALCCWHQHDNDSAAQWFEEAYSYNPDDKKSIANLATAQMFRGDTDSALATIERALKIDPEDEDSATIKANVLSSAGRLSDAVGFLEKSGRKKLHTFFEALNLNHERRFLEAAALFRKLLIDEPENEDYLEHVASNLLLGHQQTLLREKILPWKMPALLRIDFEECDRLLTRAVELLRGKEAPGKLMAVYVNRSAVRMILGRAREALSDCQEAIKLDPKNADAYLNKSKAEAELEDFDAAIESMKEYARLSGGIGSRAKELIYYYYLAGRMDQAKELLSERLTGEITLEDLDKDFLTIAVNVYDYSQEFELSDNLISRVEAAFPEHTKTLLLRAKHLQNMGKDGVEDLLLSALTIAEPPNKDFVTIELAGYLYSLGNYRKALPLFEKLVDDQERTPFHFRYLVCLYHTGRFAEALQVAQKLRGEVDADPNVSQIEAGSHIALGNLQCASEILLGIYQKLPSRIDCLVEYGICLFRLDKLDKAIRVFDQARNRIEKTKDLIAMAEGYLALGQHKTAIELSFKALNQSPNNPNAHLSYIKCCLDAENAGDSNIDEKYIKAFQDSIGKFAERFPEYKHFRQIDVGEDLSGLFKVLDEGESSFTQILDLYKQGALPVYAIGVFKGRDIFTIWSALSSMPGFGVRTAVGDLEEQGIEVKTASQCKEIIVDLLSLFTLQRAKQLSLLEKLFERVLVHQLVFEELLSMIIEEKRYVRQGRTTIGKMEGRYTYQEVPPEDIQREIEFLEGIKEFIKDRCQITGLRKELTKQERKLSKVFGKPAAYSVALASQEGIPILSDDGLLVRFIRATNKVEGFPSHILFGLGVKKKILSKYRYFELLLSLMRWNYHYIPVNANFLMYCAKKSGYRSGGDFDLALAELGRRETTIDSMVKVVADFLTIIWLGPLPSILKSSILRRVLSAITKNHTSTETLNTMTLHLSLRMNSSNSYYLEIIRQINHWEEISSTQAKSAGGQIESDDNSGNRDSQLQEVA
jgi:tetratricopeptide (TPR) repeat protein